MARSRGGGLSASTLLIIEAAKKNPDVSAIAAAANCTKSDVRVACARHGISIDDPDSIKAIDGIACPSCHGGRSSVIDSRSSMNPMGLAQFPSTKRRNRVCMDCHSRFTTYEIRDADLAPLITAFEPLAAVRLLRKVADEMEALMKNPKKETEA